MFQTIMERTHPNLWVAIMLAIPDYTGTEALFRERDYVGLVGRHLDEGYKSTYYIVRGENIRRIPDKLPVDFCISEESTWTEFLDLEEREIAVWKTVHNGILLIPIVYRKETECANLPN